MQQGFFAEVPRAITTNTRSAYNINSAVVTCQQPRRRTRLNVFHTVNLHTKIQQQVHQTQKNYVDDKCLSYCNHLR